MLVGYMGGALNKRSEDFRRMQISGSTAGTVGGVMLFLIFQLSPVNVVTGISGLLLTVVYLGKKLGKKGFWNSN
jgi:hypothetical protein